ncbi:hypothetical protein [Sphingomonas sp. Leaf4]|uniref:hypothetical protein n=1 Tax=Sphingomonas sp. Leaf4 TaxID=2876553 RepID=UPI001E4B439A|nr:hypothetical protein [Sphingomonas sp. Leaf4]
MSAHGPAGRGRPLRFLMLVSGGWVALRVTLLWPETAIVPDVLGVVRPVAAALPRRPAVGTSRQVARWVASPVVPLRPQPGAKPPAAILPDARPAETIELALVAPVEPGPAPLVAPGPVGVGPPIPPARQGTSFSLWGMARPGVATGGPVQLGGGQAGIRMRVPVAADGRVALVGRLATPLAGPGREAALGVEWRPRGLPVAVVAERRIALDSSGSGTGIGLIAGVDRPALLAGFALEAYGQAGAVVRRGVEPYADGAVRLLRPVADAGRATFSLGIGSWGGAQRGARRLDVGPSAVLRLPVGPAPLRLSIDWRQRIGGDAAPGSGPTVTLGSDF